MHFQTNCYSLGRIGRVVRELAFPPSILGCGSGNNGSTNVHVTTNLSLLPWLLKGVLGSLTSTPRAHRCVDVLIEWLLGAPMVNLGCMLLQVTLCYYCVHSPLLL